MDTLLQLHSYRPIYVPCPEVTYVHRFEGSRQSDCMETTHKHKRGAQEKLLRCRVDARKFGTQGRHYHLPDIRAVSPGRPGLSEYAHGEAAGLNPVLVAVAHPDLPNYTIVISSRQPRASILSILSII